MRHCKSANEVHNTNQCCITSQWAFNLSWVVNILLFAVKLWAYLASNSKAVLVRPPTAVEQLWNEASACTLHVMASSFGFSTNTLLSLASVLLSAVLFCSILTRA